MRTIKYIALALFLIVSTLVANAQTQILLGWMDFDSPPNAISISLNQNAPVTPNSGTNTWTVNNDYSGQGTYMDTPPQDSTVGNIGQINNPGGAYLHINAGGSIPNANYDPNVASEQWTVMGNGICTQGYSKIIVNFWWVGLGSPADYGTFHYSVSGPAGPWIQIGAEYSGADKWSYARVEDGAFINENNLSFAWKWTNDGINSSDMLPWCIDDIIIVGEYDINLPTSNIIATSISPDTVCNEDTNNVNMSFFFNITDDLSHNWGSKPI